jgi:hypothetical protein
VLPELGSPTTHVDVTYDGKYILGMTYIYLVFICTAFMHKMGNRMARPSLLKLSPLASILAGNDNKFHGGQFSCVSINLLGNQCC